MSQPRQFQMAGGQYNDTTHTKIFVGGLAWETQRDAMRRYFEQFGEIQEAVVITDKVTGKSKGYGFVTFKDADAATRACQNPSPVIDGRRANCNLASLGAHKTRPPSPLHSTARFRQAPGLMAPLAYHGTSSTYFRRPTGQYTMPYSPYGYTGYSQDSMYPMNYYCIYGGLQFSPYYAPGAAGPPGIFPNLQPFYAHYGQSSQIPGSHAQYPQMVQYPYLPHQYSSNGTSLSIPSSLALSTTTAIDSTVTNNKTQNAACVAATAGTAGTAAGASQATRAVSGLNSSS